MKLLKLPFWAVIAVLVAGFSALMFVRANANEQTGAAAPVPVPVAKVHFQDALPISAQWPANVQARRQGQLGFAQGGLLASISVDVGSRVKKGEMLAGLDTSVLAADLHAANAAAAQARANRDLAHSTYERQKQLAEQGHISVQRLDEVREREASAQAALISAKAQAAAIQARLDLGRIIAPYDGVITARMMDEGAIAGPGAPVLSIVEDGALEIRSGLPIATIRQLQPGEVVTANASGNVFKARFAEATGVINAATQSVEAVFDVMPGTFTPAAGEAVNLILPGTVPQRGFLVPTAALREGSRGLWTLFVLQPAQSGAGYVLAPAPVEILHAGVENTYVRGPLNDGQMFVSAAANVSTAGMHVVPAGQ